MIRHYDPSVPGCKDAIKAQAKRDTIWAVVWTDKKHRICPTRKDADKARRAWKLWKERQGWKVTTLAGVYRAKHPNGRQEVCGVHRYNLDFERVE